MPATELKIDRSFIAAMAGDPRNRILVRSTIAMAHELGLEVVAEGVEDEACLELLREMGCDQAQGYGISRPMRGGGGGGVRPRTILRRPPSARRAAELSGLPGERRVDPSGAGVSRLVPLPTLGAMSRLGPPPFEQAAAASPAAGRR